MAQNEDLTPHFAYFDKRTDTSYVWDGRSSWIEVCFGGYGEPVSSTISALDICTSGSPTHLLDDFMNVCNNHAVTVPTPYTGSNEHHARFVYQLLKDGPAVGESHL